jgi:exodeoxyribonuclease III
VIRILSYNIRRGGSGREDALAATIAECSPDVVVFQEATDPAVVKTLASRAGMSYWASRANLSLAFISRVPIEHFEWHRPALSRHAFLEIVPYGREFRLFGVHLSAVFAAWTERRREFELRALLRSIASHQHGFHALLGDFNTVAPGELLDVAALPRRVRATVWLSGGHIRWRTIQLVLDAGYVDAFRQRHPDDPGLTLPTEGPQVRLDYAFVPASTVDRVRTCEVVRSPHATVASDHFPLLSEFDV